MFRFFVLFISFLGCIISHVIDFDIVDLVYEAAHRENPLQAFNSDRFFRANGKRPVAINSRLAAELTSRNSGWNQNTNGIHLFIAVSVLE